MNGRHLSLADEIHARLDANRDREWTSEPLERDALRAVLVLTREMRTVCSPQLAAWADKFELDIAEGLGMPSE